MKNPHLQNGGEPAPDALDRDIAKTRKKMGAQAAPSGGALTGDRLSRSGSVTPSAGPLGSGSSADTTAQIQGGNDAQLPSGITAGTPKPIAKAPELSPKGMPARVGGPVTVGSTHPAIVSQNAKASHDSSVMGGRYARVKR